MCGIVGYVGKEVPVQRILSKLSMLEYRGYDSAGVAIPYIFGCDDRDQDRGRWSGLL